MNAYNNKYASPDHGRILISDDEIKYKVNDDKNCERQRESYAGDVVDLGRQLEMPAFESESIGHCVDHIHAVHARIVCQRVKFSVRFVTVAVFGWRLFFLRLKADITVILE